MGVETTTRKSKWAENKTALHAVLLFNDNVTLIGQ